MKIWQSLGMDGNFWRSVFSKNISPICVGGLVAGMVMFEYIYSIFFKKGRSVR